VFARVAMYEQIDVEGWEPVARWLEEHGEELNQRLDGYHGSMTLLDRENARMYGIGLYDTAENARKVDAIMDQGPPSDMPQELQEILMRGTRPLRGVYEVVQGDGRLSVSP
jgi:hypothetical protein